MNPVITELIKVGLQVLISLAKQNNMTTAELDQFYAESKAKFIQNNPTDLPDV